MGFASKEDAQRWVACSVAWYNHKHRHSAIWFVTPSARHTGEKHELLARRAQLYVEAGTANPAQWSRQIRNWSLIGDVYLNPERDTNHRETRDAD